MPTSLGGFGQSGMTILISPAQHRSEPGSDLCCAGEIKIVMPDCPKPPSDVGILVVKKAVHASFPSPGPYPATVTCGSNVTNLSLMDGVPQTINNIPYGTQCNVVETGA